MIEITLLGQPRGKERPRASRDGHFYTPERTRSYEAALRYAAGQVMGERPPLDGPLNVEIRVRVSVPKSWPAKRRAAAMSGSARPTSKPDWDNYGKIVDALNLVVWNDDAQIVDGRVVKEYSDKPGLFIRVWQTEGIFS